VLVLGRVVESEIVAEEKDGRYRERNKETTEEWAVAIGFRSQVGMSFHQRPLEQQKASER
jgi:hypothetical protein